MSKQHLLERPEWTLESVSLDLFLTSIGPSWTLCHPGSTSCSLGPSAHCYMGLGKRLAILWKPENRGLVALGMIF